MSQQRKKTKRSTETLTSRVRKVELMFKEIESQLKQAISKLEAKAERFKESEQRISEQNIELQNQIRENMSTGPNPENLITLEEGYAVNLEELEKRMEEKYSLLAEREREISRSSKKRYRQSLRAQEQRLKSGIFSWPPGRTSYETKGGARRGAVGWCHSLSISGRSTNRLDLGF